MLFLKEIPENASAAATFKEIEDYYNEKRLSLSDVYNNTADGCPTMAGNKNGVLARSECSFIFNVFYYYM